MLGAGVVVIGGLSFLTGFLTATTMMSRPEARLALMSMPMPAQPQAQPAAPGGNAAIAATVAPPAPEVPRLAAAEPPPAQPIATHAPPRLGSVSGGTTGGINEPRFVDPSVTAPTASVGPSGVAVSRPTLQGPVASRPTFTAPRAPTFTTPPGGTYKASSITAVDPAKPADAKAGDAKTGDAKAEGAKAEAKGGDAKNGEKAAEAEKPKIVPRQVAPATARLAANRSREFAAQVGTFRSDENAAALAAELERRGYGAVDVVAEFDSAERGWFMVRVGRFGDRYEAAALVDELRRDSLPASVVEQVPVQQAAK